MAHTFHSLLFWLFVAYWGTIWAAYSRAGFGPSRPFLYLRIIFLEFVALGIVVAGVRLRGASLQTVFGKRWQSIRQAFLDLGLGICLLFLSHGAVSIIGGHQRGGSLDQSIGYLLPQGFSRDGLWIVVFFYLFLFVSLYWVCKLPRVRIWSRRPVVKSVAAGHSAAFCRETASNRKCGRVCVHIESPPKSGTIQSKNDPGRDLAPGGLTEYSRPFERLGSTIRPILYSIKDPVDCYLSIIGDFSSHVPPIYLADCSQVQDAFVPQPGFSPISYLSLIACECLNPLR